MARIISIVAFSLTPVLKHCCSVTLYQISSDLHHNIKLITKVVFTFVSGVYLLMSDALNAKGF